MYALKYLVSGKHASKRGGYVDDDIYTHRA